MKTFVSLLAMATVAGGLYASTPAAAEFEVRYNNYDRVYFTPRDRTIIRTYVTTQGPGEICPPGMYSTALGCHEKTTYFVPGTRMPETIYYSELPSDVVMQLEPPPPGMVYVRVDDNVYLMNRTDRSIVTGLNLFADID